MPNLPYPLDRFNGYAVLTGTDGFLYLPDWASEDDMTSAVRYVQAFMTIARRINRPTDQEAK